MLQRSIINGLQSGVLLGVSVLSIGCFGSSQSTSAPVSPLEKRFAENPNDPKVNLQLGEMSEAQGDYLRAEQYYARAEALQVPPDEITPRMLRVLVKSKRYDEAIVRCRDRLAERPDDRATRFLFVALLQGREQNDLAERELKTLLKKDDKDASAHLAIGRLYRDAYRDSDRATTHLKKYLELEPGGTEAARVRYELAEIETLPPAEPSK